MYRITLLIWNPTEKDSLGRLRWRDVTETESAARYNYQQADYRNYKDGDLQSRLGEDWMSEEDTVGTRGMYAQSGTDFSSLVNDRARVYKGGSWRDRAYWLSPATRRFLDEESARPDLGFRCAMIRVGSPGGF